MMRVRIYNGEGKLIFQPRDVNGTVFDCNIVRSAKTGEVVDCFLKVNERQRRRTVERHYRIHGRDLIVVVLDEIPETQS